MLTEIKTTEKATYDKPYIITQENGKDVKTLNYSLIYATKICEYYSSKTNLSFHYALKGSFNVELVYPKETLIIEQGEFFIAKPNTVYTIKNSQNVCCIINMHIDQNRFNCEYAGLLNKYGAFNTFLEASKEKVANPNFASLSEHERLLFNSLLDVISSKDLYRQIESEDFLSLTFKYVLLLIDRNFVANRLNILSVDGMIKKYISENLTTANIGELARLLNYSVSYTSELITKTTGQNFKTLLREARIRKAKTLLETEKLSLEAVHLAVGYDNLGSFILAFKEVLGETPGAYRNKFLLENLN